MNVVKNKHKGILYLHWLNGITTFSFAILFSSLSLYLTKHTGITQTQSNGVVAFFLAANFILHFIAGYIGDRLLSNRMLFAISIVVQSLGIMVLNYSGSFVYLGLSLFLIGCGLGSTCINCLITQQFESHEDELREKAFFHNYSAMNIGFLAGYFLSGYIDIKDNYEHLFEMSNLINIVTIVFIIKSWKYFNKTPLPLNKIRNRNMEIKGVLSIFSIIPLLYIGFYHSWLANFLVLTTGVTAILYLMFIGYSSKDIFQKNNMYSFVFLTVAAVIFWMIYFVGPMGVVQFLKYNVSIYMGGYYIPPQWIMNLNSIFVIVGSPIMLIVFDKLRNRNVQLLVSMQFAFALLFIALSFLMLSIGILDSNPAGMTNISWIIAHYLFQSIGELLIAPVGYAMIGHLAPEKFQGLMMGVWMMVSGISATISNYFSNVMTQSESINPLISNGNYLNAFNQLGLYALFGAVIIWLCSRMLESNIRKRMPATDCEFA